MIWGEKDVDPSRLAYLEALGQSSHLLGFNEPNFGAQVQYVPYVLKQIHVALAFICPEAHPPAWQ